MIGLLPGPSATADQVRQRQDELGAKCAAPKIRRFMDPMSLPAYIASDIVMSNVGDVDRERVALLTVSSWDPTYHQPDLGDVTPSFDAVASYYRNEASPTGWLRKMVNNALCQIAIGHGLIGPNQHFVGGVDALVSALVVGRSLAASGDADHVLVVAFDPPDPSAASDHEPDGHAAAAWFVPRPVLDEPTHPDLPPTALAGLELLAAAGTVIDPGPLFLGRSSRPVLEVAR